MVGYIVMADLIVGVVLTVLIAFLLCILIGLLASPLIALWVFIRSKDRIIKNKVKKQKDDRNCHHGDKSY